MEELNDESGLDRYTKEKVAKGIEDLLEEKELKMKWHRELDSNESAQNYFKSYKSTSVPDFVNHYINQKYLWYKYGDMYHDMMERERSQWINDAHEHLEVILQKKLFDIQCLWRADEIELKGVEICFDFLIWGDDIYNCPFIEPITEKDIKLYQEFLLQGDRDFDYLAQEEWQNYEDIKASYTSDSEECEMPEWYEFINLRTGKNSLLLLPDLKGKKEEFYSGLKFAEDRKKIAAVVHSDTQLDARPYIRAYDEKSLAFFVKTFEDRDTQRHFDNYKEGYNNGDDNYEYYYEIFNSIMSAEEPIAIKSNYDFKEAMKDAYNEFRYRKLADHLPMAYEQYLFNREMGISTNKENSPIYLSMRDQVVKRILDGRELNGEARNFDY